MGTFRKIFQRRLESQTRLFKNLLKGPLKPQTCIFLNRPTESKIGLF